VLQELALEDPDAMSQEIRAMRSLSSVRGVPRLFCVARAGASRVLVMQRFGAALSTVQGQLSVEQACSIGIELLTILEDVHWAGWVHRDLSLRNICFTRDGEQGVSLIDFGLAMPWRSLRKVVGHAAGTTDYRSLSSHSFGVYVFLLLLPVRLLLIFASSHSTEPTRRDDIEAVFYVLIHLLRSLPWEHLEASADVERCKRRTSLQQLCRGLPGGSSLRSVQQLACT
jgi:serine/threonine protein kinase